MFGSLIIHVAMGFAALLIAGPVTADVGYGPGVSTSCNVDVTARAGSAISANIDVKGNASRTISGTVRVTVSRVARTTPAGGPAIWSKSARYDGAPLRIHGPILKHGTYHAVATFSADPGVYLDCQCFSHFASKSVAGGTTDNHGDDGGLPNTGGPSQWWLFIGFGLVLTGGAVAYTGTRGHAA